MDTLYVTGLLIGILQVCRVYGNLRCLECTHLEWERNQQFEGFINIERILSSNGAYDPNTPNQQYPNQQYPNQQYPPNTGTGTNGQNFIPPQGVMDTVCPVASIQINRCGYLFGNAVVYLGGSYKVDMTITVHIRNCMETRPEMENRCYDRDSSIGYRELLTYLRNKLAFLSPDIEVRSFIGHQCICSSDMCYPYVTQAAGTAVASVVCVMLSLLAALFIRL
ncbi:hypothetical protein MAR_004062 [Mya arenaria]|uniref:Uncharacterized protein n=1 Tax=Mya arenaria TaxID=6604 RepID=A0ABY7EVH3_MYAAR|nr:hypothetical protein MAR_004062 [Mya arenaria]